MTVPPVLALLKSASLAVLNTLIPPRCLCCGAITLATGTLCATCWDGISFLGPPLCQRCGHPFDLDPGPLAVCSACITKSPKFDRARSVFRYDDISRPLILRLKHADRVGAAIPYARWMVRAGADVLADAQRIVPVPMHRWRLLHRRYNQAALLANEIGRLSGIPSLPDALRRIRHTPSQGQQGRISRRRNMRGAFVLARPQAVAGQRILLIDDVLTSGATVSECVRVLRAGGAETVDVLTLARVVLAQG